MAEPVICWMQWAATASGDCGMRCPVRAPAGHYCLNLEMEKANACSMSPCIGNVSMI